MDHNVLPANYTVQALPRKHSPDGATTYWGGGPLVDHVRCEPSATVASWRHRTNNGRMDGHIKTAEKQTIIQQYDDWYTGRWWVDCYIWYSEKGHAQSPPRCTKYNEQPTHQRPVYQLQIIRRGTIITCAHERAEAGEQKRICSKSINIANSSALVAGGRVGGGCLHLHCAVRAPVGHL